jgi:hypothetical protein
VFACGFRECVGATCETFPDGAGTLCRSAAGVCDLAESCNGTSLSCPTDRKRSDTSVCRESSDPCDVAERCEGTSNDCPNDTGNAPEIESIVFLTGSRLAGGVLQDHYARVEVRGENLCSGSFSAPAAVQRSLEPETAAPAARLSFFASYADTEPLAADFPSTTYSFEFNGGVAAGTLPFFAVLPAGGSVEILAPADGGFEGSSPIFTLEGHCSNCPIVRFVLESDGVLVGTGSRDGVDFPLDTAVDFPLSHAIHDVLSLPEGHYELRTEAISGPFSGDQTLQGDSSGQFFSYVRGNALTEESAFTVPEPAGGSAAAAAAMTLRWITRRRCRRRVSLARVRDGSLG